MCAHKRLAPMAHTSNWGQDMRAPPDTTADRWTVLLAVLAGQTPPALPPLPGRHCRPLGDVPGADPFAEAWDARTRPARLTDSDGRGDGFGPRGQA